MTKTEMLSIRIEDETKLLIERASRSRGMSITTFVLDAAEKAAKKALDRPPRGRHTGVPTFFRAGCLEAQRGGAWGYDQPAFSLASAIWDQQPNDIEADAWAEEVEQLFEQLADDDAVWNWFSTHYPRAMSLVPERRKNRFADGVRRAYEEGRMDR